MSANDFFMDLFRYIKQQSKGISSVKFFISWLICIIFVHLLCMLYLKLKGERCSWKKEVWWILLLGYACIGCQITLLRREAGSRGIIDSTINIGDLSGGFYSRQQYFYSLLNILLFVPWGVLWGIYRWNDTTIRRSCMVSSYSFLTSFTIEITQLVTKRGFFELSDFVMNVIGGFIGSVLVSFFIYCIGRMKNE